MVKKIRELTKVQHCLKLIANASLLPKILSDLLVGLVFTKLGV
jgi:hypothetical protein